MAGLSPSLKVQEALAGVTAPAEFKDKSVRGGAAAVAGQAFGIFLQIGTTVVLARLLSPADYGLQSMVITLTGFLSLFKDAGLNSAAIQKEDLTQEQLSSLFWINLALGALLTLLVACSGPFLVTFYKEPRLRWITFASAWVFVFNSLVVQHRALLDRAMRFSTSAKIDALSAGASAVVAITLAALGFGYWSLIIQTLSIPIVSGIAVCVAMPWRPGRPALAPGIRSMMRFGGTVTLNGFVVYLAYNMEKILLGRYWGAAQLGTYGRAYQLANLPVQQLIQTVHSVAFPVLSRMQNDAQRLRAAFLKSLSLVTSFTIPVVIGSAVFADEAVFVVLGPKWDGVASVLRLLSPTILVFALVNPFSWFLRATGRVGRSLKTAFLLCPVVILGIVAGLRRGPPGVAMGYSTAMLLLLAPLVAWAIYGTGITAGAYWDAVKRPLGAGAIAGTAGWLLKWRLESLLPPVPVLAVGLIVSFALYACILLFLKNTREMYTDLVRQIIRRKRGLPAES